MVCFDTLGQTISRSPPPPFPLLSCSHPYRLLASQGQTHPPTTIHPSLMTPRLPLPATRAPPWMLRPTAVRSSQLPMWLCPPGPLLTPLQGGGRVKLIFGCLSPKSHAAVTSLVPCSRLAPFSIMMNSIDHTHQQPLLVSLLNRILVHHLLTLGLSSRIYPQ